MVSFFWGGGVYVYEAHMKEAWWVHYLYYQAGREGESKVCVMLVDGLGWDGIGDRSVRVRYYALHVINGVNIRNDERRMYILQSLEC